MTPFDCRPTEEALLDALDASPALAILHVRKRRPARRLLANLYAALVAGAPQTARVATLG